MADTMASKVAKTAVMRACLVARLEGSLLCARGCCSGGKPVTCTVCVGPSRRVPMRASPVPPAPRRREQSTAPGLPARHSPGASLQQCREPHPPFPPLARLTSCIGSCSLRTCAAHLAPTDSCVPRCAQRGDPASLMHPFTTFSGSAVSVAILPWRFARRVCEVATGAHACSFGMAGSTV